ncbi:MAG TPA: hypothetical protein VFE51_12755 [Verrucomicrobiae bacterium]|nr:hypothetical protein [Verrucomicrobiae bacterium]
MKTPRDALLEKHAPMQPKLDALRQDFIASVPDLLNQPSRSPRAGPIDSNRSAWRDFILGLHWHLVGLSAAWVMVGLLWVSAGTPESPPVTQAKLAPPQAVILALKANRRQVLEFGGATAASTPAVPPKQPSTRRGLLETKWNYC